MEYASIVAEGLSALKPAEPLTSGRLTLLPLTTTRPGKARFVLLAKAIERGRLSVREVSEGGSVSHLKAVNKGPWPVLIFDGEELVGAKQNRIVNATVLVGVGETVLPVSCVEQGRWSARSRAFEAGEWTSHPRLRREKELQVRRALAVTPASVAEDAAPQAERAGHYRADQGAVWDEVARHSRGLGVDSLTAAMADAYRDRHGDLDRILAGFARPEGEVDPGAVPVEGMVGVAAFLDGSFMCLDVLWSSRRFRALYPKLLRGYASEALQAEALQDSRRKKDSSVDPEEEVLRLFAGLRSAEISARPGVDLGVDLRLSTETARAAGLEYQGEMLQLSVFPR